MAPVLELGRSISHVQLSVSSRDEQALFTGANGLKLNTSMQSERKTDHDAFVCVHIKYKEPEVFISCQV